MKVKELIEQLKEIDQELNVYVQGYEGGVSDCLDIGDAVEVALNVNKGVWYYGDHVVLHDDYDRKLHEGREKANGIIFVTASPLLNCCE